MDYDGQPDTGLGKIVNFLQGDPAKTEREKIQALDAAKSGFEYDPSSGTYGYIKGSQQDIQAQENLMLKQQLQEVQNNLVTDKQWSAVVDSIESNNFDTFNEQLNSQPQLQKIFKQDLGIQAIRQLNPWDNDKQLQSFTQAGMNPGVVDYLKMQRDAILSGTPVNMSKEDYETAIKQIGNAYPIIERADGKLEASSLDDFLAKTNLLKRATKSSERQQVLDAIAMGKQALSGITDAAYKANLQSLQGTAQSLAAKGKLEASTANKGVQGNEIMMKAMATGKPEEVMKALQLVQPEVYLKNTRGSAGRMDSYTQALTAFMAGNPNATPDEIQNFNADFADQAIAGKGHVAETKDLGALTGSRKEAESLFNPSTAPKDTKTWLSSARQAQDTIMTDLDEKEKTQVMDVSKALYANHNTALMVEGLLNGQVPKVDKDAIQSGLDWVRSKVGIENTQTLNNVDFNTKSGMLLAGYIKEMSGTAASDAEVSRLLGNLLGGNLTDETYIKQSMKAFATFLRTKNNSMAKPFMNTIPYDIGRTTNLKPKPSETNSQKSVGGNKPISNDSLPPLVFPGKKSTSANSFPTIKSTTQSGKPSAASFWKD